MVHVSRESQVVIIVAYDSNKVIGDGHKLLWHIPEDIKTFKETTINHPCIMGRLTWESLPIKYRPLPNRLNIVISKTPTRLVDKNVKFFTNVEESINFAKSLDREVYIIGGGSIYLYCIENNLVDIILASEIKTEVKTSSPVFFPNLQELGWRETLRKDYGSYERVIWIPPEMNEA